VKRQINRLRVTQIGPATKDLADGYGLWLQVHPQRQTKSWLFRFTCPVTRKADSMGLGPVAVVSLAKARVAAQECREQLLRGVNPRLARNAELEQRRIEAAKLAAIPTFLQAADKFIAAKGGEWSNAKHGAMWKRTFHGPGAATSRLNFLPVREVTTPLILAALEPLWKRAPVTAGRVAQRIAAVLDFATAHHWRTGDDPAAGKLLAFAMPKAIAGKVHHAALPYEKIPAFMATLRDREGIAARLLEITVLTALRRDEARCARWDEIDLEARIWTISASRMKNRKPHMVPLSDRCVEILESLPCVQGNPHVFFGRGSGAISDMGVRRLLEEMRPDVTLHGFRSSFRDWAGDCTAAARETAEACRANMVGSAVELAYRRADGLAKKRTLLAAWAHFCGGAEVGGNVVKLREAV
jgi:integrase